jgi:hypothetical protein
LCIHSDGVALILASTDYTDGHVRCTVAHELGHHVTRTEEVAMLKVMAFLVGKAGVTREQS